MDATAGLHTSQPVVVGQFEAFSAISAKVFKF
jgi:hypothetical protein